MRVRESNRSFVLRPEVHPARHLGETPGTGLRTVARKKTPKIRVNVKASLSRRLKEIRHEQFGEHGGPELARRLALPARTWYNYETGVTVPAEVLLGFIEQTGANPLWLLNGEGPEISPPSRRSGSFRALTDPTHQARTRKA